MPSTTPLGDLFSPPSPLIRPLSKNSNDSTINPLQRRYGVRHYPSSADLVNALLLAMGFKFQLSDESKSPKYRNNFYANLYETVPQQLGLLEISQSAWCPVVLKGRQNRILA
ncbi:MAG: hypothetical protein WA939_22765 [Nodosilinea sp.]